MKAVIFDFDGTILGTETTELAAWKFIYNEYECDFPLTEWYKRIGSDSNKFDPLLHLEKISKKLIIPELITKQRRSKLKELIADLNPLPGIVDWIEIAKKLGMQLAIASSSPKHWVEEHLKRINLFSHFDSILTREDINATKPDPEIYELALKQLKVSSTEVIAIEDSPNGAMSAVAAGIRCIVVPNEITVNLVFPPVFKMVKSLDQIKLEEIIKSMQ